MTHASWAVILNEVVTGQMDNGAPGDGAPGSIFGSPIFLIVIMVMIFYFLVFMPQRQRDRQRREMLSAIKKGDQVVTSGGICGTILKVTEARVVVRVNDDPAGKIEFVREAIARVEPRDAGKKKDDGDDDGHDHDEDDDEK